MHIMEKSNKLIMENNERDCLYVVDHVEAVDIVKIAETYNVWGGARKNIDVFKVLYISADRLLRR